MILKALIRMEPELPFSNIVNAKTTLSRFTFNTGISLRNLDLSLFVLPLARNYEGVIPIQNQSIKIFYPKNQEGAINMATAETLGIILQSGTKIFDALQYIAAKTSENYESYSDVFDLEEVNNGSIANQVSAITHLTACVIILYTRGSLPGSNASSSSQALPRFVTNMSSCLNYESEGILRDASMSFDPRHINIRSIMEANVYDGWNSVVANRINLGIAGHKPLKIVNDLWMQFPENAKTPNSLVGRLKAKYDALNGGFYLNLHPAFAVVATAYSKFYLNCLKAVYDAIPGSTAHKYETLESLIYLTRDTSIVNKRLHKYSGSYSTWDYGNWDDLFGEIKVFSADNRVINPDEPIGLLVPEFEDEEVTSEMNE